MIDMKLLIVTQIINEQDPDLGFFLRWVTEFSTRYEHVHVVCLKEGVHALPPNVTVHSLGKEANVSRVWYVIRFYRYIWNLRHDYDTVFVHMNPEYVVLGGPLWRVWGKRIGLWYTHKHVSVYLRIASAWAQVIFTASKESFRLASAKVRVMGHGIDTGLFSPHMNETSDTLRIVTVGRISPTKRVREMVDVVVELGRRHVACHLDIIGAPVTIADVEYEEMLQRHIASLYGGNVRMLGPVSYGQVPRVFAHADLMLNLSATGSLDKAVLDGFAAGIPAISSNEAFRSMLAPRGLFVESVYPEAVADAIERFIAIRDKEVLRKEVRDYVVAEHSLSRLIEAIVVEYSRLV